MIAERVQDLEKSLAPEARTKIVPLRSLFAELVTTPFDNARQQLNSTNISLQSLYGDRVRWLPILVGSADATYCDLLACVTADYAEQPVVGLSVEKVSVPANDEQERIARARQQMRPNLDPRMRDYYEQQLKRRMLHEGGKGKATGTQALQEIKLKVTFANQTFGLHRVVRVAPDVYYFMPCCFREANTHGTKLQVPTSEPILSTRYYVDVVTNAEVPEEIRASFSQGIWKELQKEDAAFRETLAIAVPTSASCDFKYHRMLCPDDEFSDLSKQVLAQWVRELTNAIDVPCRGPFVCAGSAKASWTAGKAQTIRYLVACLAFVPETAPKTKPSMKWRFWKR